MAPAVWQQTIAAFEPHHELLTSLAQAFAAHDVALYLVGGSVRDALLGRKLVDLDFTTVARPQLIQEILEGWAQVVWDTGIAFGTVSAEYNGEQVEITTFRSDVYDGNSRNPQVQFGDTLEHDLQRRDFRMNAMALAVSPTGDVLFCDPLKGLADMQAKVIDTPSLPEVSFHDDPLRMLRATRFMSQLSFSMAPRVSQALENMAGEIQRITAERVQAELDKLLLGANPLLGIDSMVRSGLASYILPEVVALDEMNRDRRRHKDVYVHSLQVLEKAIALEEEPDLILRWAALLHDIGKPDTRKYNAAGKVSFYHHDAVGAKLARNRLRALKYSKQSVRDISQLIYLHMRVYGFSDGEWTDSAVRRYVTDAGELLPRLQLLVRADCTTQNPKKAARLQGAIDFLDERIAALAAAEDLARVRPALNGNEIMELLGLQPGPEVGDAWAYLKEQRLERGPMEREEAIELLQQWWAQQHSA
ncbi:MAG: CCA tRNA nucleotidyltransferase [Corynebacterium sp.]|nr:CCA tRNA nucleotidyltransferase [Corynebacterium sp.]